MFEPTSPCKDMNVGWLKHVAAAFFAVPWIALEMNRRFLLGPVGRGLNLQPSFVFDQN